MDLLRWQEDLTSDYIILSELMAEMEKVTPEHDLKLITLMETIENKIRNPINPGNKKSLSFQLLPILRITCITSYPATLKNGMEFTPQKLWVMTRIRTMPV